jgi:hypothetical protein
VAHRGRLPFFHNPTRADFRRRHGAEDETNIKDPPPPPTPPQEAYTFTLSVKQRLGDKVQWPEPPQRPLEPVMSPIKISQWPPAVAVCTAGGVPKELTHSKNMQRLWVDYEKKLEACEKQMEIAPLPNPDVN